MTQPMTMVERVAAALQEDFRYKDDLMMHLPQDMAQSMARAAIEQIGKPDKAIDSALEELFESYEAGWLDPSVVRERIVTIALSESLTP